MVRRYPIVWLGIGRDGPRLQKAATHSMVRRWNQETTPAALYAKQQQEAQDAVW
jgi:hypothetical protein